MKTFVFFALVLSAFAWEEVVQLTEGIVAPVDWVQIDMPVDYNQKFDLHLALTRSNQDILKNTYETVSDPENPKFSQWLSQEQLTTMLAAPEKNIHVVTAWLKKHGVHQHELDVNKDYIHVTVTGHQAQKMLGQLLKTYQQHGTGKTLVKAIGPIRVPKSVAACLDTIVGLSGFPIQHHAILSHRRADSPDLIAVTPKVLIQRYNVTTVQKGNAKNRKAVAEFQGQYISQSDVCTFYKDFSLNGSCTISKYIGHNDPSDPGIESSLDVDYIDGLSDETPLDYYIYPGMDFCSDLLSWTSGIANQKEPGWVHSVSYGAQYHNPICDKQSRDRLDQDLTKLNARGMTFVIASGDSGSGYYSRAGYNDGYLVPSWPASSEYVTAVGSTYFYQGNENVEEATTQFGSGGGFSFEHTRPAWQDAAVSGYLKSAQMPTAKWAKNGRGTPDVAAMGEEFTIVMNGRKFPGVGGTSASTPTFAGIVTRLNDDRLNAGKNTLGQMNKIIYTNPHMFYDVTIGSDKIGMNKQGWNCAKGWDPVSGMGTPNYEEMKKVALSLP